MVLDRAEYMELQELKEKLLNEYEELLNHLGDLAHTSLDKDVRNFCEGEFIRLNKFADELKKSLFVTGLKAKTYTCKSLYRGIGFEQ